MKTVLTIIAVLFFGVFTYAQDAKEIKVDSVTSTVAIEKVEIKKTFKKRHETARLYMFKNSRVKKELSFRTKRNRAKLA